VFFILNQWCATTWLVQMAARSKYEKMLEQDTNDCSDKMMLHVSSGQGSNPHCCIIFCLYWHGMLNSITNIYQ
jgi:hypothetical protein